VRGEATLVALAVLAAGCSPRTPPPAPPPPEPPPQLTETPLPPSGVPRFEIGPIDSRRSEDGRELYVEGSVRNVGTRVSRDLKVWVHGLDEGGAQVAQAEAFPTPQEVSPGSSARFVVHLPNDPAIRTFHVEAIGR
jgi:hypothetical protein